MGAVQPVNGDGQSTRWEETIAMLIRFECPACKGSHSFDMPETTIHMTCSKTGKTIQVRVTAGGDVRTAIVGEEPVGEKSEE